MKKALWFSRHTPNPEQLAGAKKIGWEIVAIETGKAFGTLDCSTTEQAIEIVELLKSSAKIQEAYGVFGVFPAKIRQQQFRKVCYYGADGNVLSCFESVNDARSVEGQKPTFKFLEWVETGVL